MLYICTSGCLFGYETSFSITWLDLEVDKLFINFDLIVPFPDCSYMLIYWENNIVLPLVQYLQPNSDDSAHLSSNFPDFKVSDGKVLFSVKKS